MALFRLMTDSRWLNLHHFLYVLGRAEAGSEDAARRAVAGALDDQAAGIARLQPGEVRAWQQAVTMYAAGLSREDLVFDDGLITIGQALGRLRSAPALTIDTLEPRLAVTLQRAATAYEKAWWAGHRAGNEQWAGEAAALLDRHGEAVRDFVLDAFGMPWPEDGFPVHVSAYANWAGAYSTRGPLIVVASRDEGNTGTLAIEILFHEAIHQWDEALLRALRIHAQRERKELPDSLAHAIIFFTAGAAVARAIPGHRTYADVNGLWRGPLGRYRQALDLAWQPWLAGYGSLDDALGDLLRRTGLDPQ